MGHPLNIKIKFKYLIVRRGYLLYTKLFIMYFQDMWVWIKGIYKHIDKRCLSICLIIYVSWMLMFFKTGATYNIREWRKMGLL